MSLLFLTSPAKSLDLEEEWQKNSLPPTQPAQLTQVTKIAELLKSKSSKELQKILKVSNDITQLNFDRFKNWTKDHNNNNSKPALLMYDGAVYKQIDKDKFTNSQKKYAQKHIRIISGFYGLLKPYDLIQPYRLEMNNKIEINKEKSLVKYWKEEITNLLNQEIKKNKIKTIINLASKEYSQTIDQDKLSIPFISIDFKEKRGTKLKTIAIYAKQARGAMLNYVVKNNVSEIKAMKKVQINGYSFKEELEDSLLFVK